MAHSKELALWAIAVLLASILSSLEGQPCLAGSALMIGAVLAFAAGAEAAIEED